MDFSSVYEMHLMRKNHLFTGTMMICCLIGLLFNGIQIVTNDLPNWISPLSILIMFLSMVVLRKMNQQQKLIKWIPYIGFIEMALLSFFILFAAKRVAAIMIVFVFLSIITIYMRKLLIISGYVIGIALQCYFFEKMNMMDLNHVMEMMLHIVYFTILFSILFSIERLMSHYIRDLQQLHHQTNDLNQSLVEKNKQLLKLDQLKNQFLSNVTHELKTPIHGILGITESIMDAYAEKSLDFLDRNLAYIMSGGKQLNQLVDNLLDFSRMSSGNAILNTQIIPIGSLLNPVIQENSVHAKRKSIQIIPPTIHDDHLFIDGDLNYLQQAMTQLMNNAIKFTNQGSVHLFINQENCDVIISIQDTGIGMTKDQIASLFQFQQLDGSSERLYSGLGMGLSLAKQIIDLHGGKIWIESEINKGTTVFVCLPIKECV